MPPMMISRAGTDKPAGQAELTPYLAAAPILALVPLLAVHAFTGAGLYATRVFNSRTAGPGSSSPTVPPGSPCASFADRLPGSRRDLRAITPIM